MKQYTLLALGPAHRDTDATWLSSPYISRIVRQRKASTLGKRFGSRVLGIGLDSFILTLRTFHPAVRGPYLANNPWIGAALRLTGRRDFAVIGIYAEPTSRSWRVLRRLIGTCKVIALSESEVGPWNSAGGNATAVLYGNTFRYPSKQSVGEKFRIFVGGSSDRDADIIQSLEREVIMSVEPVELILATGEEASETVAGSNLVRRVGSISPQEFGKLLSTASVVFLPLIDGTRAAGHMVMVGAVESGIPVGVTSSQGMKEYMMGPAITECSRTLPILPQLRLIAQNNTSDEGLIREQWKNNFSLTAYVTRVENILPNV